MMCEIQTSFPCSKFSPLHAAFCSFYQTHAQHIFTLPSHSLEACTTSLSHFHRAFFQEIRLISFFFGLSLSLSVLWLVAGSAMTVYQWVSDIVVDQQVVKLIITSSNHTHVWWNWSRPASCSSGPKASLYSTAFKTTRHWLKSSRWSHPSIQSRHVNKTAGAVYLMLFCLLFWL